MHLADTGLVRQESFHNPQRGGAATKHSLSSIGWRRGLGRGGAAPLLGPLPTPASWGEEEEKRDKNHRSLRRFRPILIEYNSAARGDSPADNHVGEGLSLASSRSGGIFQRRRNILVPPRLGFLASPGAGRQTVGESLLQT